ncbi:MAG: helix-turn-helix transcriptional regulator [Pseudomonadota bacterium]
MTEQALTPGADMALEDWYGPETATFGDRLGAAREQTGMTQAQLARRLGIKPSTLRAWEQDISEPRANRLSMIAGILGVSIVWLLSGEGEGLEAPTHSEIGEGGEAILSEMRELRVVITHSAERLARLEKQVRLMLKAE